MSKKLIKIPTKVFIYNHYTKAFDKKIIDIEYEIEEVWKELYFRDKPLGYFISNLGEVKKPDGQIAKLYYDKNGYTRFCLYIPRNNKVYKNKKAIRYPYKTHRAVAELFVPNILPSEYDIVLHKNDIHDCNVYINLLWGTTMMNMEDKKVSGNSRYLHGEEKPDSIFNEKDVREICDCIYNKNIAKNEDIIKALNKSNRDDVYLKSYRNLISNIKRGHCWKYISDEYKNN